MQSIWLFVIILIIIISFSVYHNRTSFQELFISKKQTYDHTQIDEQKNKVDIAEMKLNSMSGEGTT